MERQILVFRGEFDSYVTCQPYVGRIPPELRSIVLENEKYSLTVYPYEGENYLVAHQSEIKQESLEEAIKLYKPKPLN
ncbi:hypothetical protein ACH677_11150 [Klebsiella aerogenes]|uniref:hypothetical protein n=1 Tax=Klebsiella aerogenes TaxID=548 RepID=UPI001255D26A|nr:hypothetical protein [Klebsiella aerogenes]QHJ51780.1 hypothetical protein GUU79_11640 [Klebsiella aerogenes]VAG21274.1 Uncharacterised protein [Klebsiella aerogenes]HBW3016690.1 hypothetical protein [Klebsiella aerogenes]HDH0724925.1 hypothetical protein [Klebsiella aerogenes]